jgi:large conductance mechanosensitive channel
MNQYSEAMLKGFKEFALRGNVIDLAVAVVVGAAFAAVVAAFGDALIQPIVGIFLGGGIDAGSITIRDQVINFTVLINAVITFLVTITVIYFVFVLPMNKMKQLTSRQAEEEVAAEIAEDIALLKEIRDLLAAQKASGPTP